MGLAHPSVLYGLLTWKQKKTGRETKFVWTFPRPGVTDVHIFSSKDQMSKLELRLNSAVGKNTGKQRAASKAR